MKKQPNRRPALGDLGSELPEVSNSFPDISGWKKPLLMMVNFRKDHENSKILETFFEILSQDFEGKPFRCTTITIFRHHNWEQKPEGIFHAIGFEPPRGVTRKMMVGCCTDAWNECGGGQMIKLCRIQDNDDWQERVEIELGKLEQPDRHLFLVIPLDVD